MPDLNATGNVSAGPCTFELTLGHVSSAMMTTVIKEIEQIPGVMGVRSPRHYVRKPTVLLVMVGDRHNTTFVRGRVVARTKEVFRAYPRL